VIMLTEVRTRLALHARAAGFRLTDEVVQGELEWLTYRAEEAAEPVLLELFEVPADGRLVAELWCLSRLAEALRRGATEAALRRRVWHYPPEADRGGVAREITEELRRWLASAPEGLCASQGRATRPERPG
jgi:hypothetical protein